MPKKLVVTTKEETAPPPPPPPPPPKPERSAPPARSKRTSEPEDDEEAEGDPIFNSETKTVERLTVLPTFSAQPESSDQSDEPAPDEGEWLSGEFTGQLAVDVYQTDKDIVIMSAIAGVQTDDLDIQVTNDMVTIKGIRRMSESVPEEDYFTRECYWGRFSRSIILPLDVQNGQVAATIQNGVLTIRLPKAEPTKVTVVDINE